MYLLRWGGIFFGCIFLIIGIMIIVLRDEQSSNHQFAFPNESASDFDATQIIGFHPQQLTNDGLDIETPALSPDGKWVVFSSKRDGDYDLYRIQLDTSQLHQITNDHYGNIRPRWSPDGRWILFGSRRNNNKDLYRVRVDGVHFERLTFDEHIDTSPRWSPDGQWIVFASERGGGNHLYLMRPDGSDLEQLTYYSAMSPEWSPDGQWVIFSSYCSLQRWNIYLTSPARSSPPPITPSERWERFGSLCDASDPSLQQLTFTDGYDEEPQWSPDGQWIIFTSREYDSNEDLYRIRIDGTQLQQLTHDSFGKGNVAWSPDGQWIIFASTVDDDSDIYRIRPDGTQLQQLTPSDANYRHPLWSPDGQWIIFTSDHGGSVNLYRIRTDGTPIESSTHRTVEKQSEFPSFGVVLLVIGTTLITLPIGINLIRRHIVPYHHLTNHQQYG